MSAAALAALALSAAAGASAQELSGAEQRARRVAALEQLRDGWPELELDLALEVEEPPDADPERVTIGRTVHVRLKSARDAYLALLSVDAHGVLSVLRLDQASPTPASGPQGAKLASFHAAPPLGTWHLAAVATEQPALIQPIRAAPFVLAPAETDAFLNELSGRIARGQPGNASHALVQFEITGRSGRRGTRVASDDGSGGAEYSSDDIVAYFSSLRAQTIGAARLDLHVRFASDSAALDADVRRQLDVVGRALQADALAGRAFKFGGHTDDVGAPAYNLELSRRRAEAVCSYLSEEWGIAAERLEAVAYGETSPLELGSSEQARAMNRRVDFELQPPPAED